MNASFFFSCAAANVAVSASAAAIVIDETVRNEERPELSMHVSIEF